VADLQILYDQALSDLAHERARHADTQRKLEACRRSQARMLDELGDTRVALRRLIDAAEVVVVVYPSGVSKLEAAMAHARRELP
jgi:CHAD domain-containing protein